MGTPAGFYTLRLVPAGMRGKGQFLASSTPGGGGLGSPRGGALPLKPFLILSTLKA